MWDTGCGHLPNLFVYVTMYFRITYCKMIFPQIMFSFLKLPFFAWSIQLRLTVVLIAWCFMWLIYFWSVQK
jgi:hypothetical protein